MPQSSVRDCWLHARVTQAELAGFKERADLLDTTCASLARSLITLPIEVQAEACAPQAASEGRRTVLVYDRATYPQLIRQIRHWGYHYDHCLHALNLVASKRFLSPEETSAYLDKAIAYLEEIDRAREGLLASVEGLYERDRAYLAARGRR